MTDVPAIPIKPLKGKLKRFADEYLIDFNGTQAAIRAGYSERSAYSIASENLRKPEVAAYLRARKAEWDAEYEHRIMGRYEVLARLSEIAASDMGDLLPTDDDGKPTGDLQSLSLRSAKEMGKSHLIKKLKRTITTTAVGEVETQTETIEAELYSAHEALRDLGKYHALFTEKVDLTSDGKPIPIAIVKMDMEEL